VICRALLRDRLGIAIQASSLILALAFEDLPSDVAPGVDGGVNPRKSGAGQKVGTKIAVELFKANGLGG
jgi:hypothetical protein